jgi:Family of unknown function (DUF5995)
VGVRALAAAALVVALLAGLSGGAATAPPPSWAEVAPGLRAALDPRSANPCQRGDLVCFDIVAAELRRREQSLAATCDHSVLFADLSLQTTEQIRAAAHAGLFRNVRRMAHFDAWFARLYFRAQDDWRAGRAGVPTPWQVAYREADRRSVRGLGDLLLGMNAHITRDLAFAVADGFAGSGRAIDPDFLLVNRIIQRLAGSALREVAMRFDPSVAVARLPVVFGPRTFGELIGLWRAEAWRNGVALRLATPAERPAVARRIESLASVRAAGIVAATAYLPVIQSSRSRDAYCAAHRLASSPPVDLVRVCDVLSRCRSLVARWTSVEGLRGRAVVGAKAFYVNGCLACHRYLGAGTTRLRAPDLTAEGRLHRGVEWQVRLLRCPSCVLAGISMPALPFVHVHDVAAFLEASKGPRKPGPGR